MQQPTKIIKSFENSELSLIDSAKNAVVLQRTPHFCTIMLTLGVDLYILNKILVYRRESTHRFRAALLTKRDERRRIILYFMSKADSM